MAEKDIEYKEPEERWEAYCRICKKIYSIPISTRIWECKCGRMCKLIKGKEKRKKRKKKEKVTLESVEKHLQEKLKDPQFAKIYHAEKAKLKAKIRLEEILDEKIDFEEEAFGQDGHSTYITGISQATTEILKEFVHKDNLPSKDEIHNTINGNVRMTFIDGISRAYIIGDLAKAIRKLIEGKK